MRVPVKGRELASILGTLYDKRALIRGEYDGSEEKTDQDSKLATLEKKFNDFAAILKGETIIAERVDDELEPSVSGS